MALSYNELSEMARSPGFREAILEDLAWLMADRDTERQASANNVDHFWWSLTILDRFYSAPEGQVRLLRAGTQRDLDADEERQVMRFVSWAWRELVYVTERDDGTGYELEIFPRREGQGFDRTRRREALEGLRVFTRRFHDHGFRMDVDPRVGRRDKETTERCLRVLQTDPGCHEESWDELSDSLVLQHGLDRLFGIFDPDERHLSIDLIRVPENMRGHGRAAAAMRSIIRWADRHRITLTLSPTAEFGASKQRLERWYKSLGFVANKGRAKDFRFRDGMIRLPGLSAPTRPVDYDEIVYTVCVCHGCVYEATETSLTLDPTQMPPDELEAEADRVVAQLMARGTRRLSPTP